MVCCGDARDERCPNSCHHGMSSLLAPELKFNVPFPFVLFGNGRWEYVPSQEYLFMHFVCFRGDMKAHIVQIG